MAVGTYILYIDNVQYTGSGATTVSFEVTANGLNWGVNVVYTYSGEGTFLGFSKTQGASTPDNGLAIGDEVSWGDMYEAYLYTVVEQQLPTYTLRINGVATDTYHNKTISKVVINNVEYAVEPIEN